MKCPACASEMREVAAGDVNVDICAGGCGGIWFDAGELDKFDDGEEFDPQSLVSAKITKEGIDQNAIRRCPRCADQVLVRQFYDVAQKVQINQCWECSGIFLDPGELSILKSQYANNEAHSQALDSYAQSVVDVHKKELETEGKEWKKRYEETHKDRFAASVQVLKRLVGTETE